MIIDATTPKAPEAVTRETELLTAPGGTKVWKRQLPISGNRQNKAQSAKFN